jgi:hypothetical protein
MQVANRCAPWKVASFVGAATSRDEFLPKIPRRGRRIRDLMSASRIVNLILALSESAADSV